jgi:hypothetical protein
MEYTFKLTCSPVIPGQYIARIFITAHDENFQQVGNKQVWEKSIPLLDPYEHTDPGTWGLHIFSQVSSSLCDDVIAGNRGEKVKTMLELFEH